MSGKPRKQQKVAARAPKRGKTEAIERERRQRRIFKLFYLDRKTYEEIQAETGHGSATIAADLKAERAKRAAELGAERPEEIAVQLAMVEEVLARAMEDRLAPGSGAYAAATKALELRARLLGLDAPQKLEISVGRIVQFEVVDVEVKPIEEKPAAIEAEVVDP